jgi:hypothetical protein
VYFVGSTGDFPISVNGDCSQSGLPCYRTGDYSAIVYADDGLVYGASQHSQKIDGPWYPRAAFSWGVTPLYILSICLTKQKRPTEMQ